MLFKTLFTLATGALLAGGLFHTVLKSSMPAKDTKVASPTTITLTFTEGVNAAVSAISILKSDSSEVAKLVVKPTKHASTIEGTVAAPLAPGGYIIRWRTASDDGHAVRGTFAFTVTQAK